MKTHTFMAAPVPRPIRQKRLGHIPLDCVIGTRNTKADNGANIVFDIVMLPVHEFNRMKLNVGLAHSVTPTLELGPALQFGYVLPDIKRITVPAEVRNPEFFARLYFLSAFKAVATPKIAKNK